MTERTAPSVTAGIRRALAFFTDVVFPPVCVNCRRVGYLLCPACTAALEPVGLSVCARCGRRLPDATIPSSATCGECRVNPPILTWMRAPLLYVEPTSEIIHRFKYDGYFAVAPALADIMVADWPFDLLQPEVVIPVPLHPRRERRRGFNQSALLGRRLAQELNLLYRPGTLRRIRHTAPQVGLGPEERMNNVAGAFVAQGADIEGRHLLLVDDVLTTGATMKAAAGTLLAAGAASVSAYCLARVA